MLRGYDSDPQRRFARRTRMSERAKLRGFVHFERRELEQLDSARATPPTGLRRDESAVRRAHRRSGAAAGAVRNARPEAARAVPGMEGGGADRQSAARESDRHQCAPQPHVVQRPHRMPPAALRRDAGRFSAALARPPPDAAETRARPGAQMFANRLRKNLKAALDWAQRESIDCFRIYDADMPEYAFAIDQYGDGAGNRWVVVQEYAPPQHGRAEGRAPAARRSAGSHSARAGYRAGANVRARAAPAEGLGAQYEKVAHEREFDVVREQPYRFAVNFTRLPGYGPVSRSSAHAPAASASSRSGKRFLNLFAYTGTATVYAAGGGATASTTVDMSRTYLEWAKRNLALNELAGPAARLRAGGLPHVAGGAARRARVAGT